MAGTMARIDPRKALPITLEQYNELEVYGPHEFLMMGLVT